MDNCMAQWDILHLKFLLVCISMVPTIVDVIEEGVRKRSELIDLELVLLLLLLP